jgi:hypothetical protein
MMTVEQRFAPIYDEGHIRKKVGRSIEVADRSASLSPRQVPWARKLAGYMVNGVVAMGRTT